MGDQKDYSYPKNEAHPGKVTLAMCNKLTSLDFIQKEKAAFLC